MSKYEYKLLKTTDSTENILRTDTDHRRVLEKIVEKHEHNDELFKYHGYESIVAVDHLLDNVVYLYKSKVSREISLLIN